jgi:hypothetical protein
MQKIGYDDYFTIGRSNWNITKLHYCLSKIMTLINNLNRIYGFVGLKLISIMNHELMYQYNNWCHVQHEDIMLQQANVELVFTYFD